jgi:sugar phosphate isomerase/epimerase
VRHTDGAELVDEITALGFRRIEIEYRLRESAVEGIEAAVHQGRIEVSSVHNFSPLARDERPTSRGGDKLPLASPRESERREAVRLTERTILLARRVGARAIVIHAGEVGNDRGYFRELAEVVEAEGAGSERARKIRAGAAEAREAQKGAYLEAALQSLRDLLPAAEEAGVTLCVENRYYFHQIPLPEEMAELKRAIPDGRLKYWHDIGHAHVMEILGFRKHMAALDLLAGHVFGMHIHDSTYIHDHAAPGTGEIDFAPILERVPPGVLPIMELKAGVPEPEIAEGVDRLAGLGLTQSGETSGSILNV